MDHTHDAGGGRPLNIDEAADGREALALLARRSFSDWNMVPMSGLELLTAMRASLIWRSIPFVMVTVRSQKHFSGIARDEGVTLYLEKLFSADTLLAYISSICSKLKVGA